MNRNYSYAYNSHFSYFLSSNSLSKTKRERLEAFSDKLFEARVKLQDIVRGADDPTHSFMKEVYEMSSDDFCKLCRNSFNETYGLTSSCDTQLYTQVYDAFINRFSHLRDYTRMKLHSWSIYNTKNGEKEIKSKQKVTNITKFLSYLMNQYHFKTKEDFIETIERISSKEPDITGLDKKEAKDAIDLYKLFLGFKESYQKITPNGEVMFERLYRLAGTRFERIFNKYSYPINFTSKTFEIRVRTQELIVCNKNDSSKIKYFINLGDFDKNGAMLVPIKYSEEFFGDYKRFNSKGKSPSYIIKIIFKHSSDKNEVDFMITVDGERSKPVLASFNPIAKKEEKKKPKTKVKRCGSRQASQSANKIEEHYVNRPTDDRKFFDNDGNVISGDDYVLRSSSFHDVNLKHNAISAMLIDKDGNEQFKEFDWYRDAINTFVYLTNEENRKKKIFEVNRRNQIRNLKNKLNNNNLTKENEEKIKNKIKEIQEKTYKRSKKLQVSFDKNERVMKAARGRLMNDYANWLVANNVIHDVCEELSGSFGKQYAKYETKDRRGNKISVNYNSLMNFCKMTTLNTDLKQYLSKRNICVSMCPSAYTS